MEVHINGGTFTGRELVRSKFSIDRDPKAGVPNSSVDPSSNESNVRGFCPTCDESDLFQIIEINLVY